MRNSTVERPTYNAMKKRSISTLAVSRVLSEIGIRFSSRTLQYHLDNETLEDNVRDVIRIMINNHDKLINDLKNAM